MCIIFGVQYSLQVGVVCALLLVVHYRQLAPLARWLPPGGAGQVSPGESMPLLQTTYLTKSFQKRKMLNVFIFISQFVKNCQLCHRSLTLITVIVIVIVIGIVFVNVSLSLSVDIYIMMRCLCVTKNEHFLHGVFLWFPFQVSFSWFQVGFYVFFFIYGSRFFHGLRSIFYGFSRFQVSFSWFQAGFSRFQMGFYDYL